MNDELNLSGDAAEYSLARSLNLTSSQDFQKMGKVFLVGAGPGDPDLLTVRAVRVLGQADVVLHDALVSREVLALVSPYARVVNVGKRCGQHSITQDDINDLLVEFASATDIVVRLKSGDPSIFGRAGEEIDVLRGSGLISRSFLALQPAWRQPRP